MSVSIFRFACLSNIINVLFPFNHTKTAAPPIKSRDSAILFFINCRKRDFVMDYSTVIIIYAISVLLHISGYVLTFASAE